MRCCRWLLISTHWLVLFFFKYLSRTSNALNGSLLSLYNLKSAINMAPPGRLWLQCWYRKTNYIPLIWQKCLTSILYSLTRQANRYFYYLLIFCSLPNFWSCKYFNVYLTTQRLFLSIKAMFILLNWETVPSSLMQVCNLALLKLPVRRGEEGSKMSAVFNTLEHACARTRMCTHTRGFHGKRACTARSVPLFPCPVDTRAAEGVLSLKFFAWPELSTYIFSVNCSELEV